MEAIFQITKTIFHIIPLVHDMRQLKQRLCKQVILSKSISLQEVVPRVLQIPFNFMEQTVRGTGQQSVDARKVFVVPQRSSMPIQKINEYIISSKNIKKMLLLAVLLILLYLCSGKENRHSNDYTHLCIPIENYNYFQIQKDMRIRRSIIETVTNSTKEETVTDFSSNHSVLVARFKESWPIQRWRYYGLFTDDYLDILNEHWLQFPPPSEAGQRALGGFYIIFVTVGLCGNLVVIIMYFRLYSVSYYLFNQLLLDFG